MTKEELNQLGREILNAFINVHKEFGPGLLESFYVSNLKYEYN
ncbi:MAG: nuclease superfamily [Bacteroidota bacterium]|jgi:hypothetical protein